MERSVPRRASALGMSSAALPTSPEMYHRPYPIVRTNPPSPIDGSFAQLSPPSPWGSPRISPAHTPPPTPPIHYHPPPTPMDVLPTSIAETTPTICGMPLKYVSLVTLAVQNAALSIVMHYSRVSTPASEAYSPASAVLLNELLKGSISFVIAFLRVAGASDAGRSGVLGWWLSFRRLCREIFSPDCWKLSIPALLYVVQNSLQFVAISNLPVATFQVTYQMKILTTAAFSVMLLRKRLSSTKWLSLLFLAIGVGIVQIQSSSSSHVPSLRNQPVGSAHESAPLHVHIMSPLKGFGAVTAACFTSGLAGVYFEMVLKNSKADLWVRNVQLSLFSLLPAVLPIFWNADPRFYQEGLFTSVLRNFGGWAWATVSVQVLGGLITAIVIKYSDNILKGFATSLSIVLSFLASVALFGFRITPSFLIGSTTVLLATWMYNQPPGKELVAITTVLPVIPGKLDNFSTTPVSPDAPIIGQFDKKDSSPFGSPRVSTTALSSPTEKQEVFGATLSTDRYLAAPYGSPYPSRAPSPIPMPPYPPSRNGSQTNLASGRWPAH